MLTKARRYKWGETNTLPTVGANKIGIITSNAKWWSHKDVAQPQPQCTIPEALVSEYGEHCLRDYGEKLSSSREESRHYRTIWTREIYIFISALLSQKTMDPFTLPETWIPSVRTQNISSSQTLMGLGENYVNCAKTNLVIISLQCTLSFYLIYFLNMTECLDLVVSTEILEENLFVSQNLHFSSLQTSS